MNARQKVKKLKKELDFYKNRIIKPSILYEPCQINHLRNIYHFYDPYVCDVGISIQRSEDELLESIRPFIIHELVDNAVQSDIWLVDKRLN